MVLLFFTLLFGEVYYLDGTELHLKNGTIVRTAAAIKETQWAYFWDEEGVEVRFAKNLVRSVGFFTMRVEGRRPAKIYKTATRRRISGRPVIYRRQGEQYLKVRHILASGRPAEGLPNGNQVGELGIRPRPDESTECLAYMARLEAGANLSFTFYDLKGNRRFTRYLDLDASQAKKEGKRRFFSFSLPASIEVAEIGLVEVTAIEE